MSRTTHSSCCNRRRVPLELAFQLISDVPPGAGLADTFSQGWSAYQRWMARSATQDFGLCYEQLRAHMPELVPVFEDLHTRFGGGEEVGRFLTLYNPPRMVRACTQLMLEAEHGPVLLRSYDHDPKLIDGMILRSNWSDSTTLAVADCIWGALDGINAHGLTIALAFGGRNKIGDGFAAPLICRYVLETCSNVTEARAALARLPVYMPYTFAVLDAAGGFVTAFMGPDVGTTFVTRRASTNHQGKIDWPAYARFTATAERLRLVESLVEPGPSLDRARGVFLEPPVWQTHYAKASGTLYVAEYAPTQKTLHMHWPGRTERFSVHDTAEANFVVTLPASSEH